jgi:hypothetical protein
VLIVKIDGTGKFVAAGILNESQGAKPGEKIFFGRDADGKIVSTLKMLNDGSIEAAADGETGNIKYKAKGDADLEAEGNLTLKIKGDITIEGEGALNEKIKGVITREGDDALNETMKGDITREAKGKKYTIKATDIELTGVASIILKTIGSASWCPNGTAVCFLTGGPHGGPAMGITGLKGS